MDCRGLRKGYENTSTYWFGGLRARAVHCSICRDTMDVVVADDPVVPSWLRIAVFCLLGGILVVLLTVAVEQRKDKTSGGEPLPTESDRTVLLLNSAALHLAERSRRSSAWSRAIRYLLSGLAKIYPP